MTTMTFVGPSFVLEVPTDWFVFSSPQYQTMFLSPPTEDGQRANWTITIQPRENNVTPQQYAKLLHQAYTQSGQARDISEEGAISLSEHSAYRTVATLRQENEEDDEEQPEIVQQEVVVVVGDMIYVLQAVRPAHLDEALRDRLDSVFATMFDTLQFKLATLTG